MLNEPSSRASVNAIYVSDLDGTLLDGAARLSSFSQQHLTRLLSRGMRFTVATARSASAVRELLRGVTLALPIIEQNGACVTDLASGRRIMVEALSEELTRELLSHFRYHGAEPIVSCITPGGDRLWFEAPQNKGARWYIREKVLLGDSRLCEVAHVEACDLSQVLSVTTLVPVEVGVQLAASLKLAFGARVQLRAAPNTYVASYWEISILSEAATKANAIGALRKALSLELVNLVVFGDAENDLDMFHSADVCVAVGNAVPALLSLAQHVTGSNEEDGVVRWLLEQSVG
jgi:Cof subfamily protein (haloacid dehalogenase superfamily)